MNFSNFFSDEDITSYYIIQGIIRRHSKSLSKQEVSVRFELSTYKLDKTIISINNDLHRVINNSLPLPYIDEPEKGLLVGHNITSNVLTRISLIYAKRSLLFTVFEYYYLFNNRITKTSYMSDHFISSSLFYRTEEELQKLLTTAKFPSSNANVKDEEYDTRIQLFQLYNSLYNGLEDPFPELTPVITAIIERLVQSFKLFLTPTQIAKVSVFLRIFILRMLDKHPLQISVINSSAIPDETMQALRYCVRPVTHELEMVVPKSEIEYLLSFLTIQNVIPLDMSILQPHNLNISCTMTDQFMDLVAAGNFLTVSDSPQLDKLRSTILNINIQFTSFFVDPSTFIDTTQLDFFEETYPLFNDVVVKAIDLFRHRHFKNKITDKMATNLYFSYMFALIDCLPLEILTNQVYICVDFSQGSLYTDYVITTLRAFSNAHLVIERNISEHTDIYLSDISANFVSILQVVWQNPPTPSDWESLADEIVKIKQIKSKH